MKRIEFVVKDKTYGIPNAWELLTPEQYMDVCRLLVDFAAGKYSVMEVRLRYVCQMMGWNPDKVKGDAAWQNLYLLCLLYTSPSPRDRSLSRMPSSA